MDNFFATLGLSSQSVFLDAFGFAYLIFIVIAPIILGALFSQSFVIYNKNKFIHKQEKALLKIKLPQEVVKSPLAMELFLTSLYQTKGEGTFINRWFKGKVRPWFSLEIVSIGGEVRFYIWTWKFWKPMIESQLYAQYPDIEVEEVKDYVDDMHFNFNKMDLWGCQFVLTKASHFPIKSYTDYSLDQDPDEELKIDPMTPVIEFLGGLREGEQAWIQIIIRAHKKEFPKHGTWFEKVDWKEGAKDEIKALRDKDKQQAGEIKVTGVSLSKGEKDVIEAIERNVSKIPFDCGIRAIYVANKESFNDINIAGLNGAFRQYNSYNLNGFATDHATDFNYPWQDFRNYRLNKKKDHILHAYKNRTYFHVPKKSHYFVMNTESLATIYHFPGQVAKTPNISRVEAKKSEAPTNLPI